MPIRLSSEEIVVKLEDAKFYFSPVTINDLFELPGAPGSEAVDPKRFLDLITKKLKRWEGVVDENENPVECSPENLNLI